MTTTEKVYVVMVKGEPVKAFGYKDKAHEWAENQYGSKTDGICVNDVCIHGVVFDR